MSNEISIIIRPQGATSGGNDQKIEGKGSIDTPKEAEAALVFVPEGSTDVVVVGKDTFTRDQLLKIRDAGPAANAEEGGTTAADGLANGVEIQGHYAGGLGDYGHSGGGGRLSWVPSLKLAGQEHTVHIDIPVGADVGHFSMDYELPGGGEANSAFTRYGARVAPSVRWVPPWAERRLSLSAGAALGVGGLSTADSEMVSVPPSCIPDDFSQGECEPGAGPRAGNAGPKGLVNPRTGSSRGTSGAYFDVSAPIAFGVTMARGDWGNVSASAAFEPGYTYVMPSDGDGFGFAKMAGALGVRASFGGSAVEVPIAGETEDKDGDGVNNDKDQCPGTLAGIEVDAKGCPIEDKDGDGVPDDEDQCPDVKGTKEDKGCLPFEGVVTSIPEAVKPEGKLPIGVKVSADSEVSVEFKDAAGKVTNTKAANVKAGESVSEYDVPASLASGKYTVVVTMTDAKTGVKKVEEKEVVIVERVTAVLPASFAPGQPPAVADIKVVGQPKLEGVTYVIQAKDRKSGEVTESAVADKPGTIQSTSGTKLSLQAPGGKGFKKETDYTVILKNKDGHVVWTGSFEIGEAPPPPPAPKGGGGRKRL